MGDTWKGGQADEWVGGEQGWLAGWVGTARDEGWTEGAGGVGWVDEEEAWRTGESVT